MKIILTLLGLLNGGFMLLDGIYVMANGTYIGPEKPGPWALLFEKFGVDVFRLGPLFVVFGLLWLTWLYGLWTGQHWAFAYGIAVSLLTLWYLPAGTVISVAVIALLLTSRAKLGL